MTKPVFKDEQLDWDTLGDPLMDLGNALAYWVEASIAKSLFHAEHLQNHFTLSLAT